MNHRAFFNQLASRWDDMVAVPPEKITEILTHVDLAPGQFVLDVGTGTGVLLPDLWRAVGAAGRITALDVAEEMLARAREKFDSDNVTFVQGDVQALPIGDATFDRVVCFSAFPHFPDKVRALKEMKRVLRPGGKIIIAHADGREKINGIHRRMQNFISRDLLPDTPAMVNLLEEAGLKAEVIRDEPELYLVVAR